MEHPKNVARRSAIVLTLILVGLSGCTQLTDPVESTRTITLVHEVPLIALDSSRWMSFQDHLYEAQTDSEFSVVKEKITHMSASWPWINVTALDARDTAVLDIDTLLICIGTDTSQILDTLIGPGSFHTPGYAWVEKTAADYEANILVHPPYDCKLSTFIHFARPVGSAKIQIGFPLQVTYLN